MSNKIRFGPSFAYNNKGRRLKTNTKIRRGITTIKTKLNKFLAITEKGMSNLAKRSPWIM